MKNDQILDTKEVPRVVMDSSLSSVDTTSEMNLIMHAF